MKIRYVITDTWDSYMVVCQWKAVQEMCVNLQLTPKIF